MGKQKKYDIGILTFWNVPNYGTFAQAYALQKVLEKLLPGRNILQIAYLNKKHYDSYYSFLPRCAPWHKRFFSDLIKRTNPLSKYNKRRQMFLKSYSLIPHTERMIKGDFSSVSFNRVVLGSDIVWDYSFKIFDKDPFLFGIGINSNEMISYAASFGTIKCGSKLPGYVKTGLQRMDKISVRDKNSAAIVKAAVGTEPTQVLDPTWLWDFNNDSNIIKPKYQNYMIVYGQDFSFEQIQGIIEYAKANKLMLICLDCNDDNYSWCDLTIKQYELSPFAWIGFFKYAQTIATTTFHGLTFSLIFNKRFAFCKTKFIMDKAGDFLKEIGLFDLFNSECSISDMINWDWDYECINKIINEKREKSFAFLLEDIDT